MTSLNGESYAESYDTWPDTSQWSDSTWHHHTTHEFDPYDYVDDDGNIWDMRVNADFWDNVRNEYREAVQDNLDIQRMEFEML